ncbi:putative decarboxylase [Actinacidiphila reveromycinica]|uniref:Putative decarboxylase n=1 Tax=Actinacidiphila reveromycinica TaxID=659352 RepID=A0A7U3UZ02_9ACTN|nr:alanine racemase [Streptomyces sp. SN-593]BBB01177.1 putative decarboxylase [Streptomyces sp. SN-593]
MAEPLYLRPRLDGRAASLLAEPGLLHSLVDALESPLNVVLPEQAAANADAFQEVFTRHRLKGRVLFAHKASASSALLRRLAATAAGVDAASLGELRHALGCGFAPERITATGPKSLRFLWLAARTGAAVAVDSADELDMLARLLRAHGLPRCRTLLRLSGFSAPGVRVRSRLSRFGIPVAALDDVLARAAGYRDVLDLVGVSYHLDTTSLTEKATAFEGCLQALGACRDHGLAPDVVDIGGGFGISYLAHREEWDAYTSELAAAALGARPALTWGGHGYGLRNDKGTLRGSLALYPSWRPAAGGHYLDELLSAPSSSALGGRPLASLALEHLYDVHAEPGRALLDQCGLTLATVQEVRRPPDGGADLWVRLAAKADDIALEEHGVLLDPVLLPRPGSTGTSTDSGSGGPVAVHLFGHLCLETDLITRRLVHLPRAPRPGDLLVFANTAAYCMDFHSSRSQRHPAARKIAAWRSGGSWTWCLDDAYWPLSTEGDPQ